MQPIAAKPKIQTRHWLRTDLMIVRERREAHKSGAKQRTRKHDVRVKMSYVHQSTSQGLGGVNRGRDNDVFYVRIPSNIGDFSFVLEPNIHHADESKNILALYFSFFLVVEVKRVYGLAS